MQIEASHKTAAVAGAWSVLGRVPFEVWMNDHQSGSAVTNNLLWAAAIAVFFVVPVYFLVIGHANKPFSRRWFLDGEERARYGVIVKRMLVWFLSAAILGSAWSMLFTFLLATSASP